MRRAQARQRGDAAGEGIDARAFAMVREFGAMLPGIRCLLTGTIRIDSEGASHSYGPGEAWFEAGPDPVYAAASPDAPTAFARYEGIRPRLPAATYPATSLHLADLDAHADESNTWATHPPDTRRKSRREVMRRMLAHSPGIGDDARRAGHQPRVHIRSPSSPIARLPADGVR